MSNVVQLCLLEIGTILRRVSGMTYVIDGNSASSRIVVVYRLVLLPPSFDTVLQFQQEIHQEGYLAYGDFHIKLWFVLSRLFGMTLECNLVRDSRGYLSGHVCVSSKMSFLLNA